VAVARARRDSRFPIAEGGASLKEGNEMYLYIGSNGFVSAVDPKTGREVWRTILDPGLLGGSTAGAQDPKKLYDPDLL
jgi:hypothetical protein